MNFPGGARFASAPNSLTRANKRPRREALRCRARRCALTIRSHEAV